MVKTAAALRGTFLKYKQGRGRPCKNVPRIDLGTAELQYKRRTLSSDEFQLSGTIASRLLREQHVSLRELEYLQKIYILKKRYLKLISTNVEGKSFFQIASEVRQKHTSLSYQREDLKLETAWKMIRNALVKVRQDFLPFLDQLFFIHGYDDVHSHYENFCRTYNPSHMKIMANLAKEVWEE